MWVTFFYIFFFFGSCHPAPPPPICLVVVGVEQGGARRAGRAGWGGSFSLSTCGEKIISWTQRDKKRPFWELEQQIFLFFIFLFFAASIAGEWWRCNEMCDLVALCYVWPGGGGGWSRFFFPFSFSFFFDCLLFLASASASALIYTKYTAHTHTHTHTHTRWGRETHARTHEQASKSKGKKE